MTTICPHGGSARKSWSAITGYTPTPNAAIEVIALWFGQGRFVDTLEICGICGKDSDCNAAQLMTILGSSTGMDGIPQDWAAPFQDRLDTYVRGMEHLSIRKLAARTAVVARRLAEVR
mgnify:CR=1 FL=1